MNKTPTFDDFWRAYPLHVSKKRAEGAWNRLTARDKRLAIAAIPAYVAYIQTMPTPSYKTPQGWLNDRRWEDELGESQTPVSGPKVQVSGKASGTKTEQPAQPTPETCNLKPETSGFAERPAFPDGMDKW